MFRQLIKSVPVMMALLVLGSVCAHAQNGSISGQVTDPQGKAIPGAAVEVDSVDGSIQHSVKTDAAGAYSVADLPAGSYLVVVQADNYDVKTSDPQTLAAGQALVFNVQVTKISGGGVVVNVTGNTNSAVTLDNPTLVQDIPSEKVNAIPLNGRNLSGLLVTSPGTSDQSGQDEKKVGIAGSAKFSVNGGRVEYNTFIVDGSDVLNTGINASRGQGLPLIVYPSIDGIQDMQVITSNYSAQYGKTASGTVVINTKTGGANLHGNLYGFVRNEIFNARNYFDAPGRTPLYRRQDYGGTIGGPLFIPNHYNTKKDKTFFFFSDEWRLEKTPVAYNQAVPTVAERSGDFSDVCPASASTGNIYYPGAKYPDCPVVSPDNSGQNPGFRYAHADVNYDAAAILSTNIIPLPNSRIGCNTTNTTSFARCYLASVSPSTYWREELFRIDHNITPTELISFRYIHDEWSTITLTPQWGIVKNSFPTVENKLYGPGLDMVINLTQTLPHGFQNLVTLAYSVSHISLVPLAGPGVTTLARPAILDDASPAVTGGAAVAGSPLCSLVTGPNPGFLGNTQVPPQQLTECPIGHIFNNGSGGKMPGLIFQGNNGAYGGEGFSADTGYAPWSMANPTYLLRDDLSKTFGKHSILVGFEAGLTQQNELSAVSGANSGDIQGLLTFSNQQSKNSSNNAFADFLTGPGIAPLIADPSGEGNSIEYGGSSTAIKSFQQDSGQGRYYNRYKIAEFYVQDDWKIHPRLTINIGFRGSFFGAWYNAKNTAYNWEAQAYNQSIGASVHVDLNTGYLVSNTTGLPLPLTPNPADQSGPYSLANLSQPIVNGLVQCGVNGVPNSCVNNHLFNPAPRVGFAFDPFGKGRTSIRAGYGLFWEHGTSSESNTGALIGGAPLILSETQNNPGPLRALSSNSIVPSVSPSGYNTIGFSCQQGASQCNYAGSPLPNGAPAGGVTFPLNVTSIPTKTRYPYAQQWSLSVQHEIARNLVGTIAYVGSRGTHLTAERDLNQLEPLAGALNPFAPGQPITNDVCASGANTGVFPVAGTSTATGVPSSPGIGPGQPGYLNIEVACTGFPGFVSNSGHNSGQPISVTADAIRKYNGLSNILSIENVASSNYNALQSTLRRTQGSLTLGVAYTYSHSLDVASDRSSANFADSLNLKSNYASSDFDQRHLLSVDYIYDLPLMRLLDRFTRFSNDEEAAAPAGTTPAAAPPAAKDVPDWQNGAWFKTLLDHWQISGITAFQTGTPFSIINLGSATGVGAADNAGVGDALGIGSFADRVGNPKGVKPNVAPTGSNIGPLLLNPAAFTAPRGLSFGNSGRNSVNNPSRVNFNMSLLKRFSVHGENNLEFRTEVFNVFNHTQFRIYDPSHPGNTGNNNINCYGPEYAQYSAGFTGDLENKSCVAGNSFLHPVDAHDPRIMQFGLKLAF